MNAIALILIILIVVGLISAIWLLVRGRKEQERERWFANRKTVLLKILVPKNNDKTPAAAEHLFAAIHGIFRPDAAWQEYISLEIAVAEKAIEFYVNCPAELRDFVEGQIYAQYPTVDMHEVPDYARADLTGLKIAGTELKLNQSDIFPIKTFQNFTVDPLAGITGALAKVGEKEQIWVQILARPVPDSWQNKAIKYVSAAKAGTLNRTRLSAFSNLVFELFRPAPVDAKPAAPPKLAASQEAALKAAEEKATKLGYACKVRLVVLANDPIAAQAKLMTLTGAFKQFNTVNMNGFGSGKIETDPKIVEEYRTRSFPDEGVVFNIEELASLYHFPGVTVETPNIVWAGSKKGEPPASLPFEGSVEPADLTLFGMTDFRGNKQRFGIKLRDRRQHMYAIGKSGTGKSTMLENMALDDIRKGRGIAIVDPHGDFINHILDAIPPERIQDVIYFNPADKNYPIGFNLLENVDPDLKNVVASGVVGIFKKIFGESWGPRLEYILRNVILALLEYPDSTMLSIMRMLVDRGYRSQVLTKVSDPVIRDFFINEYEKYDPKFRTEAIAPIQNKVGQFLSASTIRNIVGQPKSTFSIEDAMNSRKILLVDLSIGKIGEDAAALLGSMIITKIQLAAMRRTNIIEDQRVDFYLYVDEFQNFATDSFATILSEARKYRLNIILTHQFIAQMPEPVAKAVFGNIGTLISFRVGASDAVALVKEYEPVFEANDLINLDNHHIYVKMSIDGVTRPAFSATTLPPIAQETNAREQIIHASRGSYSVAREEVEKRISDESASANPLLAAAPGAGDDSNTGFGGLPPEAPSKASKQPQVLTFELEGKVFEGRQDKEGRHWYFVAADQSTLGQRPTTTDETQPATAPAVEDKKTEVGESPQPQTPEPAPAASTVIIEVKPEVKPAEAAAEMPKIEPVHQVQKPTSDVKAEKHEDTAPKKLVPAKSKAPDAPKPAEQAPKKQPDAPRREEQPRPSAKLHQTQPKAARPNDEVHRSEQRNAPPAQAKQGSQPLEKKTDKPQPKGVTTLKPNEVIVLRD